MRWRTHAVRGVLNGYATAPTGCLEHSAETPTSSTLFGSSPIPPLCAWERKRQWDGIAVSGTTAANLQQMGDFYLSPYRMTAPMRINTRNESLSFVKREIAEQDIVWLDGLPVTKPERTLVDLCLDCEDPSLIIDAYNDALGQGLDMQRLKDLVEENSKTAKRRELMRPLLMVLNG